MAAEGGVELYCAFRPVRIVFHGVRIEFYCFITSAADTYQRTSMLIFKWPLLQNLAATVARGRIFSRVRPFYEQAVSDLDP